MKAEIYGKSVTEFGAKGDGITDDAPAFQTAFDSGCPLITVPFGRYIIGSPLLIGSDTALHAHKRAEIVLGDHVCTKRGDFLLTNRDHSSGNKNIAITGGIWNGNNIANPKSDLFDSSGYSGTLLNFFNVKNIELRDLTLLNPSAYFTRFCETDGFLIENITFTATRPCSNNDGIHLGGFCQNGIIRNLRASTPDTPNDDMVALNADDCVTRVENLDLKCGFIRNILIDGLWADSCHSFLRMLSVDSEIKNIHVNNVNGGFRAMALNMDAARYCRTPLIKKDDPRFTEGVGCVENVFISDMNVYALTENKDRAFICLESNMKNFRINNFKRSKLYDAPGSGYTVRVRNIGGSCIILEGITGQRLLPENGILSKLSSPYRTDNYRYEIKTKTGDMFCLYDGDFSNLEINSLLPVD